MKNTLGRNNPLLRRVRRHATMATLFRTVDSPAAYRSGTDQPAAERLVQATLVPQTAPDSAEQTAVVSASPTQRPAEAKRAAPEQPAASSPHTTLPTATPSSPETSPLAAQPAQARSAPPSTKPEPVPEKEPAQEGDENWNRLQAIYDAHQRKKAAEEQQEADVAQEPAEAAEEALPEAEAAEHVQRKTAREAPPKEGDDADVTAPPEGSEVLPPQAEAAPDERQHRTVPEAPAAGKQASAGSKEEAGGQDVSEQPASAGEDLVQAQAEAPEVQGSPEGTAGQKDQGGQPDAAEAAETRAGAAQEEAPPEASSEPATPPDRSGVDELAAEQDSEEQPQEPAPLEAVWPVQRKEERDEPAPAPERSAKQASTTPAISTEEAAAREEQVRARLEHVTSGQPSDSSVQLVPPRRPRPPMPAKEDRQEEELPPQRDVEASPETEDADISTEQAPPLQRRQEEPAPGVEEPAGDVEAETISTEIGPLPADLWQLLGQEPPAQTSEAETSPPPSQPSEAPETDDAVRRAIAQSEAPAAPSQDDRETERPTPDGDRQEMPEPTVQRQVERDVAPDADGSTGTSPPDAAAKEDVEAAEIDVDELARRVYGDVRRRLAVEWERVRGRL